ncbi:tetratricopeptide repeat protein [Leptolyngbya sp. BL0902]|uniref:tetratricopeptide repeat protein n=1 Tax=Leptolyngbya sp. BL0902 TaxID=1115757 RepID=UPI0018E6DC26|nr:tetratricopeptide repeat protein [Leptolyngbya sp. BL0902]
MNVQLSFRCTVATVALIGAKLADVQTTLSRQVAQAHRTEGLLYLQLERWPQAMACYQKAIPAFRAAQDWLGLGQTCCQLATLMLQRYDYTSARRWANLAVHSFTKASLTPHPPTEVQTHHAAALHLLGQANFCEGHYALAVKQLEQALSIRHRLGDEVGEALVLVDLGQVYQAQSQYWYALACYEGALDMAQSKSAVFEGRWFEVKVRRKMAKLCRLCGHGDLAMKHHLEALALGQ